MIQVVMRWSLPLVRHGRCAWCSGFQDRTEDQAVLRTRFKQDPAQAAGASAVAMAVNFAVRFVPTVVTAVMITTAINPAMRPYSMAVTPDSS